MPTRAVAHYSHSASALECQIRTTLASHQPHASANIAPHAGTTPREGPRPAIRRRLETTPPTRKPAGVPLRPTAASASAPRHRPTLAADGQREEAPPPPSRSAFARQRLPAAVGEGAREEGKVGPTARAPSPSLAGATWEGGSVGPCLFSKLNVVS